MKSFFSQGINKKNFKGGRIRNTSEEAGRSSKGQGLGHCSSILNQRKGARRMYKTIIVNNRGFSESSVDSLGKANLLTGPAVSVAIILSAFERLQTSHELRTD